MSKPTKVKEVPVVNAAAAPTEVQLLSGNASRVNHIDCRLPGGLNAANTLHKSYRSAGPLLDFSERLIDVHDSVARLQDLCYTLSLNGGWHNGRGDMGDGDFCTKIALIHSEVSEALEGQRKNKADDHLPHRKSVEVELADAVIRIMDLGGAMKLDIAGAIIEKLTYNQTREDHQLEARSQANGKRF